MESIVFFGKGGIGKSTLASNVSALLAAGGGRVLHIGCDPKMDSTLALMGRHIQPFSDSPGPDPEARLREFIFDAPVKGVRCIEVGGPRPGLGCAGTGIGVMLDAVRDSGLLEKDGYTAAVFDVLGDVVCGGFAAPLRRGFAKKVVIVVSEELLSLYSANKLIKMVENYARNGVYLAGLAVNAKNAAGARTAADFAAAVNTRVLAVIPRDPAVAAAERGRVPAVLASPKSPFAGALRGLCAAIRAARPGSSPPRAMSDQEFSDFIEGRPPAARPPAPRSVLPAGRSGASRGLAAAFTRARMKPIGLEGGQIVCEWTVPSSFDWGERGQGPANGRTSPRGTLKILIAPAAGSRDGPIRLSDWAVCFYPGRAEPQVRGLGEELAAAAAGLAGFKYAELTDYFGRGGDHYARISSFSEHGEQTGPFGTLILPHMRLGQWQRFIFPPGTVDLHIPQGAVMVEHGDIECRFSCCDNGALNLFREQAGLAGSSGPSRCPLLPKEEAHVMNTDFGALDAARGDEALIKDSLDRAARLAGPGGLVEFYLSCAPMLLAGDTARLLEGVEEERAVTAVQLGSDSAGLSERVEEKRGATVVVENCNGILSGYASAKTKARAAFMARRLAAFRGVKPSVDVNLIGFGACREELAALLERTGLTSASPSEDFYASVSRGRLAVLPAPDAALCAAFDEAGLKWLVPPAPYGFAGVRAWLEGIRAALGRRTPAAGPAPGAEKERRALALAAGRYRACFVAAPEELEPLAGGILTGGVPVLPVVLEGGFRADLLVYAPDPAARTRAAAAALALGRKLGAPLRPRFFSTPARLDALLRRPRAMKLVYSDARLDPRVTGAGRRPFSAALFEPGYDGALETVRRLLELCECDF
ncbi:MAG TPA: hypothetical protein PKK31_00140 [Elusimicrobiales bacterium]|nr:hypothetical protein [Elusimicrobiales bacterium]